MYSTGHAGISFTLYAPILFVLFYFELFSVAIMGAIIVMFLASTPDADMKFHYKSTVFHKIPLVRRLVPDIEHRGITHTVWFMGIIGIVLALVGAAVYPMIEFVFTVTQIQFAVLLFVFGAFGIFAHIVGDYITPSGINILYPLGTNRVLTIHRSNRFLFSFRPRSDVRGTLRDNGVLTVAASSRANALASTIGVLSLAFALIVFGALQMDMLTVKEGVLVFTGGYLMFIFVPVFISQWREFIRYII